MKKLITIFLAAMISLIFSGMTFAGTWKSGGELNQDKWWYEYDDGTYPTSGWHWINEGEGNVAKCYYFDSNGWLYTSTTTPDGYTVNQNGEWVVDGVVQVQLHADKDKRDGINNNIENAFNLFSGGESEYPTEENDEDVEEVLKPWYVTYTIFNSDRYVDKYITLGCDKGCFIYYTVGTNPSDPTPSDKKYVEKGRDGVRYGSPCIKPGQKVKAVSYRLSDGKMSGVTTVSYEAAVSSNKGKTGNIAEPADGSSVTNNNNSNSSGSFEKTTPRQCPICFGKGSVLCTYCHGTGIGQNASFGLGGDVYQGFCPSCGGSGQKACSGCGGIGTVGY